ncbi:3D domain-containing protein [Pseudoduganella violaceinigra]|uniref:3D domain-containing protein n=1 Tax=Pseudoduganella violaceinigra TaxID=246602 RepID=UPI000407FC8B|nr:3D domain-containing protein [Pseudoduganella violaceinigra]
MADILIATATTNTTQGSLVQVQVDDLLCSLEIQTNAFGDTLPIIPKSSRAQNRKVLFHLPLKAKLTRHDGTAAANQALKIVSDRPADSIKSSGTTDAKGELLLVLETRSSGTAELTAKTAGVTLPPFKVEFKTAWYESTFLITGYNVCAEEDFTGALVSGNGLNEKHKEDFLFSAAGVPMQGTGKASNGRFIRLAQMTGGWHRNAANHPDRVADQSGVTFSYATGVQGAFGPVTTEHSIAVDPDVIPKKTKVNIEGVGDRYADDKGSAIDNYHIDNFLGAGKDVVKSWMKGSINGTQRRVKYLGEGA